MKYIQLFEEFKIKPRAVDVPVYSTGQRPVTTNNTKVIRKQDVIIATDKTIMQIVRDEIKRLGKDADLNHIDVSQVTDMSGLFSETDFHGDVSQWDVSNVKYMYYTFQDCTKFNCDLSKWDVSKVTDMRGMFDGCSEFNQDLSGWDVSRVKNMRYMFCVCTNFNSDISSWNVGKVTNMSNMFYGCENFNQDLSGWNVSRVERMNAMFQNCTSFNQDISGWDVRNVKRKNGSDGIFYKCPIKDEFQPKF